MRSVARATLVLATAVLAAGCPSTLPTSQTVGQDEDGDGVRTPEDCNDRLASVHPGAAELPCDGVDNDCAEATPDCADGPDAGLPDAAAPAPDAATHDPPDAEAPDPDACVVHAEVCADCIDDDCDGEDDACDTRAALHVEPASPGAGASATVVVSAEVGYAWVLLAHVSPSGTTAWLPCTDCASQDGPTFSWTYTLPALAQGHHVVRFERDHVNDDPAVGAPVICAGFDVGP